MSEAAIFAVEKYHFVEGNVLYSPLLTNGSTIKSLQGSNLTVTVLKESIFLNDVKIIRRDFMISTGVVHLIDRTLDLNNTAARPEETSSGVDGGSPTKIEQTRGLTSGAKAGIGVGATAAVTCLVVGGYFARKRLSQKANGKGGTVEINKPSPRFEMTDTSAVPTEIAGGPVYELGEIAAPVEIGDGREGYVIYQQNSRAW
ncbi:hypothetical protein GE09DRAFT_629143 [Coniochaeta sp. 2T2.1]|nr:hypothetical protein GE09DRAFT_629143 [Coniochaeta sp. 2T2.1]